MSERETFATPAGPASQPQPAPRPTPVRVRWSRILGAPLLIAAVAVFIVGADNGPFWSAALRATQSDEHRLGILTTLSALVLVPLVTVLSLALGTKLLRVVAALLLLVAASCGYFMTQYGVVIDQSMIRNAVETTALPASYAPNAFLQYS